MRWNGAKPNASRTEPPWVEAIKMNSPLASFSVRQAEELRHQNRTAWDRAIPFEVRDVDRSRSSQYRIRALELLCHVGPEPSEQCSWNSPPITSAGRRRAVGLLGQHASDSVRAALATALSDSDPFVRRLACEGLMQQPADKISVSMLLPLQADPDRSIRFAGGWPLSMLTSSRPAINS